MNTLKNDKKGDFTGILYAIIMIGAFAFFIILAGYIGTTISGELKDQIGSDVEEVNQSFDATINVSEGTLSALWYVVFGGLLLGLMITAWYMPTHPVMVAPFIVLLVIAVILGVALSNAYEKIYGVEQFADVASTQTSVNFMMSNLPYVALVIGVIVLIVTFAKPGMGGQQAPLG